jgi:hypothetical protein
VSTAQSGGASSKSKAARRRTLDEELRTSDGVTEADLRELDIEPHVYTALPAPNFRRRTIQRVSLHMVVVLGYRWIWALTLSTTQERMMRWR